MRLHAIPKEHFLTKGWQYNHVYKHGRRIGAKSFTFIYAPNSAGYDRLGISISGVKLAVKRNRLKRLIKEFYRFHPLFPSAIAGAKEPLNGFDLVISTNKRFVPRGLVNVKAAFLPFLPAD